MRLRRVPQGPGAIRSATAVISSALEERIADEVSDVLARHAIPAGGLVLEVIEGVLHEDEETSIARLVELRRRGARIAIDDFGTGYSSLSHLTRMPVDLVKIAKPFVDGVADHGRDALLARAVIRIGRALNIETVAEGIEHDDQHRRLRSLRCDLGQGFHFAEPVDAEEFGALIAEQERAAA